VILPDEAVHSKKYGVCCYSRCEFHGAGGAAR
jgi:hypothetical protein